MATAPMKLVASAPVGAALPCGELLDPDEPVATGPAVA